MRNLAPVRLSTRSWSIIQSLALAVLAVVSLSACSLQQPLSKPASGLDLVGQKAPDLTGTDLDGKPLRLKDYQGQPVVLNFWASWCGPCRAEQPGLNRIANDYRGRGVRLVGIDMRDNIEQARVYRDEFKMPYPSLFDQAAQLAYAYHIDAPPSSVFIGSNGIVAYTVPGGIGEENFRRIIDDTLLSGPSPR